jgi:protein SCO1/2
MSSNFGETQKALKALANAPTNWHLAMLSFDPEFDTPGILKVYAKRYGADPAKWTFLTGAMIDIDALTEQFGMQFARDGGGISHNVRTVVVDTRGRVRRIIAGNEWKPEELVAEIVEAAAAGSGAK